jgi:hypothetical protein
MRISCTADSTSGIKQETVLQNIWDKYSKYLKILPTAKDHNVTPKSVIVRTTIMLTVSPFIIFKSINHC